jgi:alpha-amylase/alpha-mannosidase (GH57 family)
MVDKHICIHGHFYQPPRENPWLEDVELQDSAYPYHDWNEKITEECYRQNAASRILGSDRKIIDIVNNYSKISFDFGPTLLFWMAKHAPEVYERIIEAEKESRKKFSGHSAAIAQAYNHMIMPLANKRDKYCQVAWGIYDFENRFGHKPEGMWLPETAVDMETLEILADHNIKFTILAPHQAKRLRQIGEKKWANIERDKVDTTRAYLCQLPSGKTINLFFFNQPVAQDVADGRILQNGEVFARTLAWIVNENGERDGLANIATDGETYGHHHRHADMALAYCLHFIETNNIARITVYGEYLEKFPPQYEVQIYENSSWSCSHGIERWRSNCGCNYGRYPSGKQQWRAPLREAMDWLRNELVGVYESRMARYVSGPWEVRNRYISVINDRSTRNVEKFLSESAGKELSYDEKVTVLKLLEMQRNAMLMCTSCGWFFDDICGIEAVQIMNYASRAMQLAKEIDGQDFEPGFENIIEKAPPNVKEFANGKEAYQALVKPISIDLNRVGAHLVVSSVFEEYPEKADVYSYSTTIEAYDRVEAGIQTLATGRASIQSNIVLEKHVIDFAVLHLGDHNLICAVNARSSDEIFYKMKENLTKAFSKGDTTEVMRVMNVSFKGNNYSLWHLFKDQQRRILYKLLETTWQEITASFRHIYEHNYTIMQIMRDMNMPLPTALSTPAEFIINQDLCQAIQDEDIDLEQLKKFAEQATRLSLKLDETMLRFEASRRINDMMRKLEELPEDVEMLDGIGTTLHILLKLVNELNIQAAQNSFFSISKETYPKMNEQASLGNEASKKWVELFRKLAKYLNVKVE